MPQAWLWVGSYAQGGRDVVQKALSQETESGLGCTPLLCSRKGVPRMGTREVTEVAVRFLVPGFNGNDFWEELAQSSCPGVIIQIPYVLSICIG